MAFFSLTGAKIIASAVTLGTELHIFAEEPEYYDHDPALLKRLQKQIGFGQRYIATKKITTADLCLDATTRLLTELNLKPQALGAIISVTQTPTYIMPGNAHLLHGRLGLNCEAPAFDLEMGCSGFIYGLAQAALLCAHGLDKILLVVGDTLSHCADPKDRTTGPLFGDAGSAILIGQDPENHPLNFLLRSDGRGLDKMYLKRQEPTETQPPTIFMDGFGIFTFTMTEQSQAINDLLHLAKKTLPEMDYVILHQANEYIVQTITSKMHLTQDKAPAGVFSRYGNLNGASIPAALGLIGQDLATKTSQALLQGFGIGLSWGGCQLTLDHPLCLEPTPLEEH